VYNHQKINKQEFTSIGFMLNGFEQKLLLTAIIYCTWY